MNLVVLLGRLGRDPELKYTANGQAVSNFSIATNESWKDKNGQKQERTEWTNIVTWGNLSELCKEYLKKGSQCLVQGRLSTRSYQAKDGTTKYVTEVIAETVKFLDNHASAKNAEVPQGEAQYFTE